MANVSYFFGSWVSGGPQDDLAPGEAHYWFAWGFFDYGGAISLTAHPVVGAPVERRLAVENVFMEGDPGGRRLYFSVRNIGNSSVPGYGVGYGTISQ